MPELRSEFLFTITVGVSQLHDVGQTPLGLRHIDLLGPGTFEGPRLSGKVLPGGMDQKLFRPDGAMNPNVRLEEIEIAEHVIEEVIRHIAEAHLRLDSVRLALKNQ